MFVKQLTNFSIVGRLLLIPVLTLFFSLNIFSQSAQGGLACIGEVNLSLDETTCSAIITPDMVLNSADYKPATYTYEVVVTNLSDVAIANSFGIESLGQRVKAGIRSTNIASGAVTNFCWSYVNVEYKFVPEIICPAATGSGIVVVSCLADPAQYGTPDFTTSCGVTSEVVQIGADIITNVCDTQDTSTIAEIVRSYQAVNAFGGFSNICQVKYRVQALKRADLTFPTIVSGGTCKDEDVLTGSENLGIPFHVSETGSGTADFRRDTTYLYPTPASFCNILVSLESDTISSSQCETKVLRKWTIRQWLCNNKEDVFEDEQILTIKDSGPEITCLTEQITARASGRDCLANVNMPKLIIGEGCSTLRGVKMTYPGGELETNGGNIALPTGINVVQYTAIDECNNESTCDVIVNVNGNAPPVVICEQGVVISLTNNGTAHVPASVFDDGSYGCGFSHVLAAKMREVCEADTIIENPDFKDHVKFCCSDGDNPPMVRLRAYNYDGTYNECMADVSINDKNPISLVCPSDIDVSCEFVYDDNLTIFGKVALSEVDRQEIVIDAKSVTFPDGAPGRDGLATGGCEAELKETVRVDSFAVSCGTGIIIREFEISKPNDPQSVRSCRQTINIVGATQFDGDIEFPSDTTLTIGCNVADIDPKSTGTPSFTEGDCQQLAATYVDETFTNVEIDGTCRKIFRYWTVIDWCNTDDFDFPIKYPIETNGRKLQVIKVVKNSAPVVSSTSSSSFSSIESSCLVSDVSIDADVVDCLSSEFRWEFFLDLNCDSTIDSVGSADSFTGAVEAGDHCITFYATDLCGNVSNAYKHDFEVRNNKGPSAICIANLTVTLQKMTNPTTGVLDTIQMLWAKDIDSGSSQSCGNDISFSFSPTEMVDMMTFSCSDTGARQRVGLYVKDLTTGNVAECWTAIEVQQGPTCLCSPAGTNCAEQSDNLANVSGLITTEFGDHVAQAEVSLIGTELPENMTDLDGQYAFNNMPLGGAYTVTATKNTDHINGVSTLDLVMIQKHILGLDILDSPYKMIAADINKSNNISAADIVELRKLILGEQVEFNTNSSWRFIDMEYEFPESSNPWYELFPEEYDITSLEESMKIDFIGVKIGDVSGNASANNLSQSEVRNSSTPLRLVSEVNNTAAQVVYKISSSNFNKVEGFQTTLEFDPNLLAFDKISSDKIVISNENVGTSSVDKGLITISWAAANSLSLDQDQELFEITFTKVGTEIGGLRLNSKITSTEAYFDGAITDKITLTNKSLKGLSLSQNEPNPWKDKTSIEFNISENGYVGFNVMDLSGKLIISRSNYFSAGDNKIVLDRVELPSAGLYFYEIFSQGQKLTKKMIILE